MADGTRERQQSYNVLLRNESGRHEPPLRIGVNTRWSIADENEKDIGWRGRARPVRAGVALGAPMGRASGMADALCCLELDVARYQDRVARSTANFLCRYPFSRRNHRAFCRIRWAGGIVTAALV